MSDSSVLIAEDEAIVATHLAGLVRKLGYKVAEVVSSGTAAVSKTAQLKPDVVLMDIRLEGEKDGVMAAQVIGKRMGTPVIYVTANTDPQTIQRARATNPAGYVVKPFSEDKLAGALENALERPRGSADVEFKGRAAILLIDSSVESRAEVVKALGHRHRVILSPSFDHAVQLLSTRPFDLILIDIATPDAGGHGAIRKLRRHLNITIPIVVLSKDIDQNTVAFLKSDVEGFVNKSTGLSSSRGQSPGPGPHRSERADFLHSAPPLTRLAAMKTKWIQRFEAVGVGTVAAESCISAKSDVSVGYVD